MNLLDLLRIIEERGEGSIVMEFKGRSWVASLEFNSRDGDDFHVSGPANRQNVTQELLTWAEECVN